MRTAAALLTAALALSAFAPPAARAGEAAPGAPESPEEPPVSPEALAVVARLADVESLDAAGRSRLAAALAAETPWPRLVEALSQVGGDIRRPHAGPVVLEALGRMGPVKLQEMLRFAAQEDADWYFRVVALQTAARAAGDVSLSDLLDVGASLPPARRASHALPPVLRDAVRAALVARPRDVDLLRSRWGGLERDLRRIFLESLEPTGPELGTRAVSRLLGAANDGDEDVLAALAGMPIVVAEPYDPGTSAAVARALSSENADLRRTGAAVAARVGGPAFADRLVELLSDPERTVSSAAHAALVRTLAVNLAPDAELWTVHLATERAWIADAAEREQEAMESDDPAVVATVLERIGVHRIHRETVAPWAERFARHPEKTVRLRAIRSLGRLARPASLPVLVAALDDPEAEVVGAAVAALPGVTGLTKPKSAAEWKKALPAASR